MPCPSMTTSDEEITHNPHRPKGLRRHWPGFVVPAPRRWGSIDFVAAPITRTNGARNGRYRGARPDPFGLTVDRHGCMLPVLMLLRRGWG